MAKLDDLLAAAGTSASPVFPPKSQISFGGIDPLGLRQINFDIMDRLLPGLNNVARHIRPFVLTAWSWRRAAEIAKKMYPDHVEGAELRKLINAMTDFVDRIEVIFLWSQILGDRNVDLPGKGSIEPLLLQDSYVFSGNGWEALRQKREGSVSFRSAVNYGPGLRALKWLESHPDVGEIMIPTSFAIPALDAFEEAIADLLPHPAFGTFGSVEVTREDAESWTDVWALTAPSEGEQRVASELLMGEAAPEDRRDGMGLIIETAAPIWSPEDTDEAAVRHALAEPRPDDDDTTTNFAIAQDRWRRLQTRQAFRLALESLFGWITQKLEGRPKSTGYLVDEFLQAVPNRSSEGSTAEWLRPSDDATGNPNDVLETMKRAGWDPESSISRETAIVNVLSFCLNSDLEDTSTTRPDRLPLARAIREAGNFGDRPVAEFMRHVIEAWVIAQHTYWSIGRGLADARANGKRILRLRVVMEEGGWSLAAGRGQAGRDPWPTGDRLTSALSLADEAGLLSSIDAV